MYFFDTKTKDDFIIREKIEIKTFKIIWQIEIYMYSLFQLENASEREQVARKEAEKVSERLVQLEKDRTSLELELRGMTSRYEQEARALREANAAPTHNHQSSAQALAGKLVWVYYCSLYVLQCIPWFTIYIPYRCGIYAFIDIPAYVFLFIYTFLQLCRKGSIWRSRNASKQRHLVRRRNVRTLCWALTTGSSSNSYTSLKGSTGRSARRWEFCLLFRNNF